MVERYSLTAGLAAVRKAKDEEARVTAAGAVLEAIAAESLPPLLAYHALSNLLSALLPKGGSSAGSGSWALLGKVLASKSLPASEPIPQGLLQQLAKAVRQHDADAAAVDMIVRCLSDKFSASYFPSLDTVVELAAAVFEEKQLRPGLGPSAGDSYGLDSLIPLLELTQASVWSAVPGGKTSTLLLSLLKPLAMIAFVAENTEPRVKDLACGLMTHMLFEPQVLPLFKEWTGTKAAASGFGELLGESSGDENRAAKWTKKSSALQELGPALAELLEKEPMVSEQFFPWLLATYTHALRDEEERRIKAEVNLVTRTDARPSVKAPPSSSDQELASTDTSAMSPSTGAFVLYAALVGLCWARPDAGLDTIATMTAGLQSAGAYRPNEDVHGRQRSLLTALCSAVLDFVKESGSTMSGSNKASSTSNVSLGALRVFQSLFDVESRAIQPSTAAVLSFASMLHCEGGSECDDKRSFVAATAGMVRSLVQSFAETRQLPTLLEALVMHTTADATSIDSSQMIPPSLIDFVRAAVPGVPSGQSVEIARVLAGALRQREVRVSVLQLLTSSMEKLPVTLVTAGSVALGVRDCLVSLAPYLSELLDSAVLHKKTSTRTLVMAEETNLPAALQVYLSILALHAHCAALDPGIKPLVGQDPRDSAAEPSLFAALVEEGKARRYSAPWTLAGLLSASQSKGPDSALAITAAEAMSSWAKLAHEHALYAQTACLRDDSTDGMSRPKQVPSPDLVSAANSLANVAGASGGLMRAALSGIEVIQAWADVPAATRMLCALLRAAGQPEHPCHAQARGLLLFDPAADLLTRGESFPKALTPALVQYARSVLCQEEDQAGRSSKPSIMATLLVADPGESDQWADNLAKFLRGKKKKHHASSSDRQTGSLLTLLTGIRVVSEGSVPGLMSVLLAVMAQRLHTEIPSIVDGPSHADAPSQLTSVLSCLQALVRINPTGLAKLHWKKWIVPLVRQVMMKSPRQEAEAEDALVGLCEACIWADLSQDKREGNGGNNSATTTDLKDLFSGKHKSSDEEVSARWMLVQGALQACLRELDAEVAPSSADFFLGEDLRKPDDAEKKNDSVDSGRKRKRASSSTSLESKTLLQSLLPMLILQVLDGVAWQWGKAMNDSRAQGIVSKCVTLAARVVTHSAPTAIHSVPNEDSKKLLTALPRALSEVIASGGNPLALRTLADAVVTSTIHMKHVDASQFANVLAVLVFSLEQQLLGDGQQTRLPARRPMYSQIVASFPSAVDSSRLSLLSTLCRFLRESSAELLRLAVPTCTQLLVPQGETKNEGNIMSNGSQPTVENQQPDPCMVSPLVAAELTLAVLESVRTRSVAGRRLEALLSAVGWAIACACDGSSRCHNTEAGLKQSNEWVQACVKRLLLDETAERADSRCKHSKPSSLVPDFKPFSRVRVLTLCTLLRICESIAARPRSLPLSAPQVSMLLHSLLQALDVVMTVVEDCCCAQTVHPGGSKNKNNPPQAVADCAAVLHCVADTLAVIAKHQKSVTRLTSLLVLVARRVLAATVSLSICLTPESGPSVEGVVSVAKAVAHALEMIAALPDVNSHIHLLLVDYIILVATDPAPDAWQLLGLDSSLIAMPAIAVRSTETGSALREGVFALYNTCTAKELQFVYLLLGSKPNLSLERREALAQLKSDYERLYRYTGRV